MTEHRTWALEFGDEFKVPKLLDDMVGYGYLTDNSWHNDVSPHFERITHRGTFSLWVNHPDQKQREFDEQPRYQLFLTPCGEIGENPADDICLYEGDSFPSAMGVLVRNAKDKGKEEK